MQQSNTAKTTPQTLHNNNTQKTSHHQYTHSKILDFTPTKNPPEHQQMPTFKQTVVSDLPKQNPNKSETKIKEPTNATKGTTIAKVYVPNEALKEKGCCLDTKLPAANECRDTKSSVQKSFRVSLLKEAKDTIEAGRRKALKGIQ